MKIVSLFCIILIVVTRTECARILGMFHLAGKSHYMACSTLMKILAEKGHDVTVVAALKEKNPPKNYHQIHLDGLHEIVTADMVNLFNMKSFAAIDPIVFHFLANNFQELAFNHTKFKEFMNTKQHFDAVIVEEFQAEAIKYVAHHFNAPLIVYSAIDANDWTSPFQGNPENPSYLPNTALPHLTNHMSFCERLENSLFFVWQKFIYHFFTFPSQNRLLHKYYPNAPDLQDIAYNVSLVLLNSDPSVHEPVPKVPSMKDIGGFHIRKTKPLPDDLQSIIDSAQHGVIFFSIGSNVKSVDMPKEKRDLILKTFSKLKETVIWKFEDTELPGKPDNVVIRSWLPQNDIFAHNNVKLFISHGGLFSTMEAVYHGLPVLALPIFAEQELNAKRAEANGFARHIPFDQLTEENFSEALNDLLRSPKYGKNAKRRSEIMRDKPMDPADAVNYWVEYVIRHKGAPHLRVAALDLEWYQYLLIDVVIFVVAVTGVFIYCVIFLCRRWSKEKSIIKEKKF